MRDALPAAASCERKLHEQPQPGPLVGGAWEAIEPFSIFDTIVSPMPHLNDVPDALRGDWARAHTEVFDYIAAAQAASDDLALERGLKWYFVLHDILLRTPPRTSRTGGNRTVTDHVPLRFAAWRRGDRRQLVEWLQRDRERGWRRMRDRDHTSHMNTS